MKNIAEYLKNCINMNSRVPEVNKYYARPTN